MAIKVRNLTKFYGSAHALKGVSFDVKTGEILGFLGPNGAGKSTTMKIITCYIPPSNGIVEVDDFNIFDHSLEVRKKIGYLPESNPHYFDMNVMDSLKYYAKLHGLEKNKIKERMEEMIKVCGLEKVRHKDIGELSKGYKQRVGLAQALIHDPEVLILDEPTTGLDPNQIIEIRNLIKEIGKEKTVILSTHILSEVQATCDRVVIINEGKIVANGKLDELQDRFQAGELISIGIQANNLDPQKDILSKLKEIQGTSNVTYDKTEENIHYFNISTQKGQDLRDIVFKKVVENNWILMEMQKSTASLEELFHKLTISDKKNVKQVKS